jgi:hypothetical protein
VLDFPAHERNANQNYIKISSQPERIAVIMNTTTNVSESDAKQELLYTVGGNAS